MTGRSDGALTFTAGGLAIDLTPGPEDDAGNGAGTGSPAVDCALAEDAPDKGLLATVPAVPDAPGPAVRRPPRRPAGRPRTRRDVPGAGGRTAGPAGRAVLGGAGERTGHRRRP